MRIVALMIASMMFLSQSLFAAAPWLQEPAGAANVLDCPFSGSICSMTEWGSHSFATLTDAPMGAPFQVFDDFLPANASAGSGTYRVPLPNVKEIYVATYWKTNPDFQGYNSNSNKLFFISGANNSDNNGMTWVGQPYAPKQLSFFVQGSTGSNLGVNGFAVTDPAGYSGNISNNVSDAVAVAGDRWHLIEIYVKASTTSNGIYRLWFDGTLRANYDKLNWYANGISGFEYNHTWDNQPSAQCYNATTNPAGRDCSKSWHHYWDHLRISIPNGAPLVPTSIKIAPANPSAEKNKAMQLTATVLDQNSFPLATQPAIAWSVSGSNTIANGLFQAGSTAGDFTVTASSGNLSGTTTVKVLDFVPVNLKINCGNTGPSVPGWEEDAAYVTYGNSGTPYDFRGVMSTAGVTNPAPAAVYSTVRHYNHSYSFPACPRGNYLVRLHFVDGENSTRAMNYTIEGVKVLDNFNIAKEAGGLNKALVKEFNVTVNDDNGMQIAADKGTGDDAFEAGIEIVRNGTAEMSPSPAGGISPQGLRVSALSNNRISVIGGDLASYAVSVYDCTGKRVRKVDLAGREHIITGLGSGVYVVAISYGRSRNLPVTQNRITLMR